MAEPAVYLATLALFAFVVTGAALLRHEMLLLLSIPPVFVALIMGFTMGLYAEDRFGLAPVGAGWVVWRDEADLPEDLIFRVNYLGGEMPTFAINFSRPAGQVIAQYYNFVRLGREGYRQIHAASYAVAQYLAGAIARMGPFELLCAGDPARHIPAVTFRIQDGADPGYTLFDLSDRLRARGWQVPAYTLTGDAADIVVCRILCRQGLSMDLAGLLLEDLARGIAHFDRHPVAAPMTEAEVGGFRHG